MITRTAKLLLLAGVAFFYSLVVFNNLTDFDSNYQLVRHVLMMDTTFPGNHGNVAGSHVVSRRPFVLHRHYCVGDRDGDSAVVGLPGTITRHRRPAMNFEAAKRIPVIALTLSLLMWLVAFISVGGEWFLMWQSHAWNGEETAFRDFTMVGIVLLIVMFPERDVQP